LASAPCAVDPPIREARHQKMVGEPVLGGLHHVYHWRHDALHNVVAPHNNDAMRQSRRFSAWKSICRARRTCGSRANKSAREGRI
jgi:hypothetical protein